jgi:7-cyano-7-deazaguanine synthase
MASAARNSEIEILYKRLDSRLTVYFKKDEIVKKAIELKAPLISSWSCYERNDKACGVCDSCALRLRGFEKVGLVDPIEYDQRPSYL